MKEPIDISNIINSNTKSLQDEVFDHMEYLRDHIEELREYGNYWENKAKELEEELNEKEWI